MKATKVFGLLALIALASGPQARAGTSIGVEFLGRDGSGDVAGSNPATPGIAPTDVAGVLAGQQQY